MKKHLYLIASIMFAGLLLSGCSKDDNDDDKGSVARVDTYAITPPFVYGRYLVNNPSGRATLDNNWGTKGSSFHVFVLQGNAYTEIGTIHSKETSIASADTKKPVHIDVPIPASIDVSKPYKVVATGASEEKPVLTNNRIVCEAELKRGASYCPSWYILQGGVSSNSQSSYLINYEGLYISNHTGKSIKVKHKGFDTADKWYCKKGRVSITPSLDLEMSVISSSGEAISDEITIEAGKGDYIASSYIPTGKKMTNAQLVLEIDGKEVKTPVISSDISIENGNYYRMDVKWDGTNLEWD